MSTDVFESGVKVGEIELLDLFPAPEGRIEQYYGRIGGGKTYSATAEILESLRKGRIVYANWRVQFDGTDQRQDFFEVLFHFLTLRKRFYRFPKENLRYIDLDDDFMDKFEQLTDCEVYLDEGHIIFDSYQHAKFSMQKRKSILHTRHFNRSIIIISQRPTAVHVSARANVNIFYRCECVFKLGSFIIFKRSEFQDMVNESVDEEEPLSEKYYIGHSRIFNAYDSKYLRGDLPVVHSAFDAYDIPYSQQLKGLLWDFPKRAYRSLSQSLKALAQKSRSTVDNPVDNPVDNLA